MKKSFLVLLFGVMFLAFAVGGAQARMMNWTETNFIPGRGPDIKWDPNSVWGDPIENSEGKIEVILFEHDLGDPTNPFGTLYEFAIPNFYDPLPLKTIVVTMVGLNPTAGPYEEARVLDIIGSDSDYDNGGPAKTSVGISDGALFEKNGNFTIIEFWHIVPNVDSEIVKIFAPIEFELESINIKT